MYGYFAGTKWPFTRDRVPLNSRVTLGSRVSLILCITQLVFHAREGALRGKGFLTFESRETLHGRDISPCKNKK